jgi:hypothetical protein
MSGTPGTLELVAIELSKLLQPLQAELATPAGAKALFAQLGFTLTDAQVANLSAPMSTASGNIGDLIRTVAALVAAIEAEDYGTVTAKSIEAIQRIVGAINALSTIGNQLSGVVGLPAQQVAKRVFDYLAYVYTNGARELNDVLELAGLLERDDHDDFTVVNYHFDRIGAWFSNPGGQVRTLYDWGSGFDGRKLFAAIEKVVSRAGLPVIFDNGPNPRLDLVVIDMAPTRALNTRSTQPFRPIRA